MINQATVIRQRNDTARALLNRTPEILRQPWLLAIESLADTPDDPAWRLLQLVSRTVDGDADAERQAQELLSAAPAPPNLVQDAAAWSALLNCALARQQPYDRLLGDVVPISAAPYPLFDALFDRFPPAPSARYGDADILTCQHILGSTVPLYEAIRRLLPRAHFWEIIGKPYSANPLAVRVLEEYQYTFSHESARLPDRVTDGGDYQLGMYKQLHRRLVRSSVRRFFNLMSPSLQQSDVPILVIDDGGTLIDAVGRMAKERGCRRPIVCIEQTQRGLYAAHPVSDPREAPSGGLAIINVAQALSKLALESPLIAKSVIENLDAWLMQLRPSSDDALSLQLSYGVIGFGSVGESILTELRERGVNASVYDLNHNRRAAAARLGLNVALSLDELLDRSDVVIGATGGSWLNEAHARHLREGVVLASASSGDGEFHGLPAWKSDQMPVLDGDWPDRTFDTIHGEIRIQRPDGAVLHILNGGFPVNFNGSVDPIAPPDIQLTRTLLLAGVLQAVGFTGNGGADLTGQTGVFDFVTDLDRFLVESQTGRSQI